MTDKKVLPCTENSRFYIEKIFVSNIPDIGDSTGETLLNTLEEAILDCRTFIKEKGFRLTDIWMDSDEGIEFILKKKKISYKSGNIK